MTRRTTTSDREYVYLIQEREFKRLAEPTYKIGRTRMHPDRRLGCYPKDSEVMLLCDVENCKRAEAELKKKFGKLFKPRREYGVEYYEGNVELMKIIMMNTIYQGALSPRLTLPSRIAHALRPLPLAPVKRDGSLLRLLKKHKTLPMPPSNRMFLPGTRLEPPRAGMMQTAFLAGCDMASGNVGISQRRAGVNVATGGFAEHFIKALRRHAIARPDAAQVLPAEGSTLGDFLHYPD